MIYSIGTKVSYQNKICTVVGFGSCPPLTDLQIGMGLTSKQVGNYIELQENIVGIVSIENVFESDWGKIVVVS